MNFVAQVEEQLRDLGAEARRKHPGVKEASERAILTLRTLQNLYVVAVRRATTSTPTLPTSPSHPTTTLFRSQDILRPFLLAANYPDASFKLITLALNAMQLLVGGDAVFPEDSRNVVRVLGIQGNVCVGSLGMGCGGGGGGGGGVGMGGRGGLGISGLGSSLVLGFTGILGGGGNKGDGEESGGRGMGSSAVGYSSSTGQAGNLSNRTWKEDEAISIRILQTLTMIVDSRGLTLTEEVLSQCLSICLVFLSAGVSGGASNPNNPNDGKVGGKWKVGEGAVGGGGGGSGGVWGSVRKVRRAAGATLRQLVAIVFDRAAAVGGRVERESAATRSPLDEADIITLQLASRTLLDLCALADYRHPADHVHPPSSTATSTAAAAANDANATTKGTNTTPSNTTNANNNKKMECTGPFAQALTAARLVQQRLQPPPRSVCFDLLDMVLKQHVSLFTSVIYCIGDNTDHDALPNFPSLLRNRVCPLISNTLTSEFVIGLNGRKGATTTNDNTGKSITTNTKSTVGTNATAENVIGDSPSSFSLLLILTQLASTIVTVYGNNILNPLSVSMHEECHVLLVCLVKFVKAATELFRDLHDFEDGFIYTNTPDSSTDPNYPNDTNRHHRHNHISSSKSSKNSSAGARTSSLVMWRAAIALEFLYMLISEHIDTLLVLNSMIGAAEPTPTTTPTTPPPRDSLISPSRYSKINKNDPIGGAGSLVKVMVEAVCEFSIVASSSRVRIIRVAVVSQYSEYLTAEDEGSQSHQQSQQGGGGGDMVGQPERKDSIGSNSSTKRGTLNRSGGSAASGSSSLNQNGSFKMIHPNITKGARDAMKSIDEWDTAIVLQNKVGQGMQTEKINDSSAFRDGQIGSQSNSLLPSCDIGEAVWVGLNFVVSLWKSINTQTTINTTTNRRSYDDDSSSSTSSNASSSTNSSSPYKTERIKPLIDGAFAPSVAVFQHFLRRFPASPTVSRRALHGYISLANNAFPMCEENDMQKRATLTSLCRLALPMPSPGRWKDVPCQLQDHHIATFAALLRIIHSNHNFIGANWQIILDSFEQLFSTPIKSTKLSKNGYRTALAIATSFGRLGRFSRCMSMNSVRLLVDAVIGISKRSSRGHALIEEGSRGDDDSDNSSVETSDMEDGPERESIGGKLFSFAGRALTGSLGVGGGSHINTNLSLQEQNSSEFQDDDDTLSNKNIISNNSNNNNSSSSSNNKTYGADFCDIVYKKLTAAKPTTSKTAFRSLPYALVLLTDLTIENSHRFVPFSWEVNTYLCKLASSSDSAEIRIFAMDAISNFVTAGLDAGGGGGGSIIQNNNDPLQIERHVAIKVLTHIGDTLQTQTELNIDGPLHDRHNIDDDNNNNNSNNPHLYSINQIPQEERLAPLCTSILMSKNRDSAEAGLNTLHLILEGAGHNLSGEAWITIFEAISALSGCTTNAVSAGDGDGGWIDRSDSEWGTCCTLAFRCLKLIVDDFLDELPEPQDASLKTTCTALLDCCASFGSSKHDVNISLTATGMLWTVADQDPLPSTVDYVLSRLAFLSSDNRPEVRNCSVNTLFSCIVGLGPSFSPDQWRICLSQTIFGVLDQIASRGLGVNVGTDIGVGGVSENDSQISSSSRAEITTTSESSNIPSSSSTTNNTTTERYKVSVHHSRDSSSKQWATTQVLTLRGIERVLRQYFGKLVQTILVDAELECGGDGHVDGDDGVAKQEDQHDNNEQQNQQQLQWFELAWSRILGLALQCSTQIGGRETLDVRLAGVDMLVLCAQVSSKSGILAVTNPQRVSTNMQVVDGALRSVRPASSSSNVASLAQHDGIQEDDVHVPLQDDESSPSLSANSTENNDVESQKYGLFKEVFRSFGKLRVHLNDHIDEEDTSASIYMETTSVQVMTKFCQGLSKLYECCKDNELFPSMDLTLEENSTEQHFVELVGILITKATGPPGSKYLSQAQRLCLELLQSMALSSSSLALELLVQVGGQAFLWQADDIVSNKNTHTFTGCEPLNNQAATIVSDTCLNKNVAWISKLRVVCKITELFSTHFTATEGTIEDTTACYKLLVPVMGGGLEALLPLEKAEQTLSSSYLTLEKVADKVLTFLSLLLTTEGSRAPHYLANTKEILQILTACSINMPRSKDAVFGEVLLTAVKQSVIMVKLLPIASDSKSTQTLENSLQIFKQCFKGTSRLTCGTESLHSIIAPLFKDAIHIIDESERKEEILVPFDINIKLATTLCESLYQVTFVTDIAAELFPYLCKLMNSAEPNLRRGASNLLTRIDFGGVLERTKEAELKASSVAQLSRELTQMSHQMLSERDRAVAAEAQVEELDKRYESLFASFESLKLQKDRLEQQVAVLSEGSAYT